MTWNPTNTDDVTLVVSRVLRDESGSVANRPALTSSDGTYKETSAIVVDDFAIETSEDLSALSGIGNPEALGISRGDIEHSFNFTIQGEDAEVFQGLVSDDDGRALELEILVLMEDYKDKLTGAYAGTRNLSGSSGDPTEFEVEGIATGRTPGTVSEDQ